MRRLGDIAYLLILALLLFGSFLVIFDRAMVRDYYTDENQFVASGKLLEAEGLLPYRDYPYFHMPNLIFVYALIDRVTDFNLLGARSFSALCSWAAVATLVYAAHRFFQRRSKWLRLAVGAGGVLLLLINPLFVFTSGFAWNHDFPVLLTMVAAITLLFSPGYLEARWMSIASGFMLGLAVGTRLTFLTVLVPFLGALAFYPGDRSVRGKILLVALFMAGFFVSMLPSFLLFISAPRAFIFGNIEYARLNTLYRQISGFEGPMTFSEKLDFLNQRVLALPGNLILLAMIGLLTLSSAVIYLLGRSAKAGVPPTAGSASRGEGSLPGVLNCAFLISLPAFLLVGSFLPTPSWYQYFYTPLPFLILMIIFGLSYLDRLSRPVRYASLTTFFLGVLLVNVIYFDQYPNLQLLTRPGAWFTVQTRVLGYKIKTIVGDGRVLTVTPLFPLDGGAKIYPEFATGKFAWRVAGFLTPEERQAYKVLSKDDLIEIFESHPPEGILLERNRNIIDFFETYVRQKGYAPVEISKSLTLWVLK